MIYYEVIIDCGDGSSAVRRFRTLAEAWRCVEIESEYDGPQPEYPKLIDTESEDFFDILEEEQ